MAEMESSLACGMNSQALRAGPHAHTAGSLIDAKSLTIPKGKNKKKIDLFHLPFCFSPHASSATRLALYQCRAAGDVSRGASHFPASLQVMILLVRASPVPCHRTWHTCQGQTLHMLQAEALPKGRGRGEDTREHKATPGLPWSSLH